MFSRKHKGRRSTNIVFVIFRLILSIVIFTLLLGGVYSAYKHFSGFDPLKLDPKAILNQALEGRIPKQALGLLSSFKLTAGISQKISQKVIPESEQVLGQNGMSQNVPASKLLFKFLLVADSHNDISHLKKALNQAKQSFPDIQFIVGLGDYTEVGTLDELKSAKKEFDTSGLRYFLLPGDHDLWDSRDKGLSPDANFRQVFGPVYQSFSFSNFKFMLLYNSDNYVGMGDDQLKWVLSELDKAKAESLKGIFVFVHEPLYHPSSDHIVGRVEKNLKHEASNLVHTLAEAKVKKIFAGDIHFFSQYTEPESKLEMVTIGAITIDRNPQSPRFGIVSVFDNGTSTVEDVEIR